ncbi:MAG: type II secretion system inner membrane protein GspF [Magnetococcales bacterium]|nr:type II secretion system inner membrane protein GspF [Magnetococcales bacterium]
MGTFEFTALDDRGRTGKGVEEGESAREVRDRLRERGLTPLRVEEVRGGRPRTAGGPLRFGRGVAGSDVTLATRQMATLLRAALPVEEVLRIVAWQTGNRRWRAILLAVRARVMEGRSLAEGLAEYPWLFADIYRETVAAGESSGRLDRVLERLAEHLERGGRLKRKIGVALIYPGVVVGFSLLIAGILVAYVVPEITKVFDDFGQALPPLTQGLIAVSAFLRGQWHWLALGLAGAWLTWRLLARREGFVRGWHGVLLRLPLSAMLVRGLNTARLARTLGILTASGVPLLEGLRIAGRGVSNLAMREAVVRAADRVREGGGVHRALAESGLFSPMVIQLIASGEASGNLAGLLEHAAEAQEQEVETLLGVLTGLLEPLMVLLMGGLVLTIVLAILLPIFNLNQLIQ